MAQGKKIYTDAQKEAALEVYRAVGANEAHRRTGIDKKTLRSWAAEAGTTSTEIDTRVGEQQRRASARAAQERTRRVNLKIDSAIDTVVRVIELSMARELQVLGTLQNPTVTDLRAITSARTTAMRDFEMLLRRAGQNVGSADQHDLVETVKEALRDALEEAGLSEQQAAAVGVAFAHRMRLAAAGEAPTYGPQPEGDATDDAVIDGEVVEA